MSSFSHFINRRSFAKVRVFFVDYKLQEKFCQRKGVFLLITSLSCMEKDFLPNQRAKSKTRSIFAGYSCVVDACNIEVIRMLWFHYLHNAFLNDIKSSGEQEEMTGKTSFPLILPKDFMSGEQAEIRGKTQRHCK